MILYDNGDTFGVLIRLSGSVLPLTVPVGLFTFAIGLTLTVLREHSQVFQDIEVEGYKLKYKGDTTPYIADTFALKTIATVVGILLAVRANLALNRWMDGISQIQLMLSKWGDAFIALSGFFAGKTTASQETRERILLFRVRIAHWFSLMSCLAFATVRARVLTNLEDVPIVEMFEEMGDPMLKPAISFTSSRTPSAHSGEDPRPEEEHENLGLQMMVLSAPSAEEIELLEASTDKVNAVYYWIIAGIVEEIRAKTLDAPPPIVSRVFQEVSNGKLGFNQAHKVAMVPFPFPFAQMVSLLLVMLYCMFPFYIELFTRNRFLSPVLCLMIPICYCGLNHVAVELEEPFGTDWNDVDIEVRHEEFLWMLVDALRQDNVPPYSENHKAEKTILKGISEADLPLRLEPRITKYLEREEKREQEKQRNEAASPPAAVVAARVTTDEDISVARL